MGNRVSIRFVNSKDKDYNAPVIFSHWGGTDFVESALQYCNDLLKERTGSVDPLDRFEPRTVTCDFLYNLEAYYPINLGGAVSHRISHDIYIGIDENDGDNGDNGHFNLDLGNPDSFKVLIAEIASLYRET